MEYFRAINFLAKLKKRPPPEEEPFLSLEGNEVFCIYELVAMILSDLPALDLLVLQMVNRTCRDVVNRNHEFQRKLFMKQDPPEDDGKWEKGFDANGLKWNPFLEHFGESRPWLKRGRAIRIKRKHLRKHDHAEASWKRMFMSYPTRIYFHAAFDGRFFIDNHVYCGYHSKVLAENMEFLAEADRDAVTISTLAIGLRKITL